MTTAAIDRARVSQCLPWPAWCDSISRKGRACVFDREGRPLYTTAQAAEMLSVSVNTIQDAIRRGVMAYEQINPRLNMVTLDAIETYRRERLGQRGGYRGGAGRRPTPKPAADASATAPAEDLSAGGQDE